MSDRTSLGNRMKKYEGVPDSYLVPRMPVILRLDGKAFHTLTRGMDKPIDWRFNECMALTAQTLCENIDGAKIAYTQSDEISLLLVNYRTLQTQPWFGNRVQKMCSVAASIATASFNSLFLRVFPERGIMGLFDCRAFNLPKEEVVNYFIWRQQDASRNSVASLAQAHFSHKELHGKDFGAMQDMLMLQREINWNACPTVQKRGLCITRGASLQKVVQNGEVVSTARHSWGEDNDIPRFSKDRGYIQQLVDVEEG